MNENDERIKLPVILRMKDQRELHGDILVNLGGALDRTLNNETKFISFLGADQTEKMIAKDGILEVEARKATKSRALPSEGKVDSSDPYVLLGLEKTATDEQIRAAFLERAKEYHADRFASVNLPREIADYANAMSKRINEAYAILMAGKQVEPAAVAQQQTQAPLHQQAG